MFQENIAIILGPGPGHPYDYKKYFPKIKMLLGKENIFIMGICLGFQLIGIQLNYSISLSANPLHGERISLIFRDKKFLVQRYNSLAILPRHIPGEIEVNSEVMILEYQNGQAFQFHPESIGSSNSLYFFNDLIKFLEDS
jgi:anthranilate/para-aminobenzoate synthase component II